MAGLSSASASVRGDARTEVPFQHVARRFAELICPPEVRADQRADRVLGELGLMLGSLPPAARTALAAALVLLDQGARLYPPSRGRRFARLGDEVADPYVRAVLARRDPAAELIRRLKSVITMCYYELPEVQREIGYDPAPYIAAVSRRRLESYGPDIRAGEAAVTAAPGQGTPEQGTPGQGTPERGTP